MKKANVFIFGSIILAIVLGIYGQGMAYFLNERMKKTMPIYYLTAITGISVSLFLVTFFYTYIVFKKHNVREEILDLYLFVIGTIGVLTSLWSIFVLLMWWG